jgi:hypothetical protein
MPPCSVRHPLRKSILRRFGLPGWVQVGCGVSRRARGFCEPGEALYTRSSPIIRKHERRKDDLSSYGEVFFGLERIVVLTFAWSL